MKKIERRLEIVAAMISIIGMLISFVAGISGNIASAILFFHIDFWTIISITIGLTVTIFTLLLIFYRGISAVETKISEQKYLERHIRSKFYRGINYFSAYILIFLLYTSLFLVDYLTIELLSKLLINNSKEDTFIREIIERLRFISITIYFFAVLIHSIYYTVYQIKIDQKTLEEERGVNGKQ